MIKRLLISLALILAPLASLEATRSVRSVEDYLALSDTEAKQTFIALLEQFETKRLTFQDRALMLACVSRFQNPNVFSLMCQYLFMAAFVQESKTVNPEVHGQLQTAKVPEQLRYLIQLIQEELEQPVEQSLEN